MNKVTLVNLKGGAAVERFNKALEKVFENIADPNTKATGKRSVILKLDITPDDGRRKFVYDLKVDTKLCGEKQVSGEIYFGRATKNSPFESREGVALEQEEMWPEDDGNEEGNITDISVSKAN